MAATRTGFTLSSNATAQTTTASLADVTDKTQTVFVTGASGFIAGHCILRLLKEGYAVRGSLRTSGRADEVRTALQPHVSTDDLSFATLDLCADERWEEALEGCTYLLHVASPFPSARPDNEDDLFIPALIDLYEASSEKAGLPELPVSPCNVREAPCRR